MALSISSTALHVVWWNIHETSRTGFVTLPLCQQKLELCPPCYTFYIRFLPFESNFFSFCNIIPISLYPCLNNLLFLLFFHPMCKHSVMSPCRNRGLNPIRALLIDPPCGLLTTCLPALLCQRTSPWQALLISASLGLHHESAQWQLKTALLEKAAQQVSPHHMDRPHTICLVINWVAIIYLQVSLFLSSRDEAFTGKRGQKERKTIHWAVISKNVLFVVTSSFFFHFDACKCMFICWYVCEYSCKVQCTLILKR